MTKTTAIVMAMIRDGAIVELGTLVLPLIVAAAIIVSYLVG